MWLQPVLIVRLAPIVGFALKESDARMPTLQGKVNTNEMNSHDSLLLNRISDKIVSVVPECFQ
jgi:hypothetical protein